MIIDVLISVDPLAEHPNQVDKSPYSAFWNNPIKYNDPNGMCPKCPLPPTHGIGITKSIIKGMYAFRDAVENGVGKMIYGSNKSGEGSTRTQGNSDGTIDLEGFPGTSFGPKRAPRSNKKSATIPFKEFFDEVLETNDRVTDAVEATDKFRKAGNRLNQETDKNTNNHNLNDETKVYTFYFWSEDGEPVGAGGSERGEENANEFMKQYKAENPSHKITKELYDTDPKEVYLKNNIE